MKVAAIAAGLALASCGEVVDPEPLGDYTTWKRLDVRGPAPGHGDSYRIIYANPIAADPAQSFVGGYPCGAVIVKEIHADDGGAPGELRYVAIMRRPAVGPACDDEPWADEGGWLFSQASTPGGEEVHKGLCWNRCHVAAPYAGAWYDYRR